jgi:hypothetical protein
MVSAAAKPSRSNNHEYMCSSLAVNHRTSFGKETIMLKATLAYVRYALSALATVGFALSMN